MNLLNLFSSVRHSSETEELPNEFEQETVRAYVCERELYRPDLTIGNLLLKISLVIAITFASAFLLFNVLTKTISFSSNFTKALNENFFLFFFIFFSTQLFLVLVFFLKRLIIELIKVYQHYAPEEVRRRCLFMPTCSEYTIMVLEKYGLILGLHKAYIRIFKKCRGNIYRVDNP